MENSTKRVGAQQPRRRAPWPALATVLTTVTVPATVLATVLTLGSTLLTLGCVYRIPIQQGNYLDPTVIAQVKPGMTRSQVRYLLGTPMVPDAFDNSRWDYDYYFKNRRLQTPRRGHVVIYFEHDVVARVESDVKAAPPLNYG